MYMKKQYHLARVVPEHLLDIYIYLKIKRFRLCLKICNVMYIAGRGLKTACKTELLLCVAISRDSRTSEKLCSFAK